MLTLHKMKNKIKEFRKKRGLTQNELSELIGVSRQAINAIEKEKFNPSLPTAFKLSELFKTSIEELFIFKTLYY